MTRRTSGGWRSSGTSRKLASARSKRSWPWPWVRFLQRMDTGCRGCCVSVPDFTASRQTTSGSFGPEGMSREDSMIKIEALAYPLMLLAGLVLFGWSVVSASRAGSTAPDGIAEQLLGVLMVLLGFATSALFAALARRPGRSSRNDRMIARSSDFSPALSQEVIAIALPHHLDAPRPPRPWTLTSAAHVGRDNALALAKLRLDIEDALRQLAYREDRDATTRPAGALTMGQWLVERGALPAEVLVPMQQLLAVCDDAVHGATISNQLADSVIVVGESLLQRLLSLPTRSPETGSGTPA